MYHYQFCDRGYDITGSFSGTRDATEVRIWAQDGILMVRADKHSDGWHISASDAVSNWPNTRTPRTRATATPSRRYSRTRNTTTGGRSARQCPPG
jgi:hypothetical protein